MNGDGEGEAILDQRITTRAKNKTNNNHKIFWVVLSEFPGIFHLDPRVISLGSPFTSLPSTRTPPLS